MAGFILCRSKYAEKPYYINNMAINIYSMEELCYYIYNNIYLIGTDLIDEGLVNWIDYDGEFVNEDWTPLGSLENEDEEEDENI